MDGNSSVKQMTGSGHADEHAFTSSLFISADDVEIFKDDVKNKPGKETANRRKKGDRAETSTGTGCADRWGATVASTAADETVQTFDQTGIFLCACRHGIVESVAEMRHSGELAKYALATVNQLLDQLGDDQTRKSKDIGSSCQSMPFMAMPTIEASNAVARVIRFSSHFHWQQFLDLHFKQWNQDRYADLSKFLFNNYKQAGKIIAEFTPQLLIYKQSSGITDTDIQHWPEDELKYLNDLQIEPEIDAIPVAYVEALMTLKTAQADYDSYSGFQFVDNQEAVRSIVQKRTVAHRRVLMAMTAVEDLEALLKVKERWSESSNEYRAVVDYINQREFIRTVCELEGLVVQRLFELSKANLAGTAAMVLTGQS
ncbi:hypothetical protein EW026_g4083 [Hermanssonia centrifuga]|uniref:Uncharacterized protein n=1 Tax=Hermanssonia centrifuga TaxID=98765 RepID=A0A4S4KI83_9APHY|nr:hypothetical protein EW026_g4083 [Hermanssonia centrifuga]